LKYKKESRKKEEKGMCNNNSKHPLCFLYPQLPPPLLYSFPFLSFISLLSLLDASPCGGGRMVDARTRTTPKKERKQKWKSHQQNEATFLLLILHYVECRITVESLSSST